MLYAEISEALDMVNAADTSVSRIEKGRYELEEIPNPYNVHLEAWLVFKDTKIGMSRSMWEDMADKIILQDSP